METLASRRTFVKATGAAALAASSLGFVGTAEAAVAPNETQWDEEFDVVVVGAGVAGMSSAITVATEGNGASCLLIEKGEVPSGNTKFSGGRCVWTNDADLFHTYMVNLYDGDPTTPDEVLWAFANGCTENLNWILSLNPIQEEMTIEEPGEASPSQANVYPEFPELDGSLSVGNFRVGVRTDGGQVTGPTHLAFFLEECVTQTFADAIDYRTSTKLIDLVQDPQSKEILGIIMEQDGVQKAVKANAGVILCCGGFEANPQMMWTYFTQKNVWGLAGQGFFEGYGNTGDGHKICQKIGADFWHMNSIAGVYPGPRSTDGTRSGSVTWANGIIVGTNGRRFFMDINGFGPTYPAGSDLRLSSARRHGHINYGGEWPHMFCPETTWFLCDANGAAAAYSRYDDPVAEGIAYSADSLEELAQIIDVPVDELLQTAQTWNGYCDQQFDAAFYRPAAYMQNSRLETPPFYATKCGPCMTNTDGGPRRNEFAQIIDVDGNVIPHLYSSGEFGSVWSHMYQGGCNLCEGMIFGRIAVRTMLGLEPKVYEHPYVSNKKVAEEVADSAAITAELGIEMNLPENAQPTFFGVFSEEEIGVINFKYNGNNYIARAKATAELEDIADAASVKAEDYENAYGNYTIFFTKPSNDYKANYSLWYDEKAGVSRSIHALTTEDTESLQALTEAVMAL